MWQKQRSLEKRGHQARCLCTFSSWPRSIRRGLGIFTGSEGLGWGRAGAEIRGQATPGPQPVHGAVNRCCGSSWGGGGEMVMSPLQALLPPTCSKPQTHSGGARLPKQAWIQGSSSEQPGLAGCRPVFMVRIGSRCMHTHRSFHHVFHAAAKRKIIRLSQIHLTHPHHKPAKQVYQPQLYGRTEG